MSHQRSSGRFGLLCQYLHHGEETRKQVQALAYGGFDFAGGEQAADVQRLKTWFDGFCAVAGQVLAKGFGNLAPLAKNKKLKELKVKGNPVKNCPDGKKVEVKGKELENTELLKGICKDEAYKK